MENQKNNPNEVENLNENGPSVSNDDLGENTEQTPIAKAYEEEKDSSDEDNGQDGERRIETPQFPVENQDKPDSSDDPQEDIETIAP